MRKSAHYKHKHKRKRNHKRYHNPLITLITRLHSHAYTRTRLHSLILMVLMVLMVPMVPMVHTLTLISHAYTRAYAHTLTLIRLCSHGRTHTLTLIIIKFITCSHTSHSLQSLRLCSSQWSQPCKQIKQWFAWVWCARAQIKQKRWTEERKKVMVMMVTTTIAWSRDEV